MVKAQRKITARELQAMVEVSRALRAANNREEVVEITLDEATRLVGVDGAALISYNANDASITSELGVGKLSNWTGMHGRADRGLAERVVLRRENHLSNAVDNDPYLENLVLAECVHAVAAVPLATEGVILGMLVIASSTELKAGHLRLLGAVAEFAAHALERASLHDITRIYSEQLAAVGVVGRRLTESLDLAVVYNRLGKAVLDLLPDISGVIVSRYQSPAGVLRCAYRIQDDEIMDVAAIPPLPIDPQGRDPQSQSILSGDVIIVNGSQQPRRKTGTRINGANGLLPQSVMYVPMLNQGKLVGVMEVQSYSLYRFADSDQRMLPVVAHAAAIAIQNAERYEELQDSFAQTVIALAQLVDLREPCTPDHSHRLAHWSAQVASVMGLSPAGVKDIQMAAWLHDIGKMGIPDATLQKAGPLSEAEWVMMRQHPVIGAAILEQAQKFKGAASIVRSHHEKYDGSGYPEGLVSEQIPLGARILAAVDAYGSMIDERTYRKARIQTEALAELKRCSGTHFDPQVVEAFLMILEQEAEQ